MRDKIDIGILTPKQFNLRNDTSKALDLICNVNTDITPQYYGNYEPLRSPFDPSQREGFLDALERTVFFKRNRPRVEGGISVPYPQQKIHGNLSIHADALRTDTKGLIRFVQQASRELKADFAYLHLPTEYDVPVAYETNTGIYLDRQRGIFSLYVTTHPLKKYIPELYWATVFGPAYIEHFGRDVILSSPAPIIRELSAECIYLQLSESPFDLKNEFERVDSIRQAVKKHLDNNSFFDLALPADHVYNVPEFKLELDD